MAYSKVKFKKKMAIY